MLEAISISRLLQGNGSLENNLETFNPLFTVTANTKAALAALDSVVPTILENRSNTVMINQIEHWDGIDMTGSFGNQLNLIYQAVPKGVNIEQDHVADVAVKAFKSIAKSFRTEQYANNVNQLQKH